MALDDQFVEAHVVAAQTYLALAKARYSRAMVEKGKESVKRALALNPRLGRAKSIGDELVRLAE